MALGGFILIHSDKHILDSSQIKMNITVSSDSFCLYLQGSVINSRNSCLRRHFPGPPGMPPSTAVERNLQKCRKIWNAFGAPNGPKSSAGP